MQNMQKITPCLWFDDRAEAAAQFYTEIFSPSGMLTCWLAMIDEPVYLEKHNPLWGEYFDRERE